MRTTPLTEEETREAVVDALDSLPPEIADRLDNVAVIVEDRHPPGGCSACSTRGEGCSGSSPTGSSTRAPRR